jgi:Ni/Fe-hydrogenase subunit HybB-like protein
MTQTLQNLLKAQDRLMTSNSKKFKVWIGFLCAIILWGVYALYLQYTKGHIITGMRDHVVWGIYIVNFIFFIGLGYAGSVISALLYLGKVKWRTPIVRTSSVMMLIATIIGPLYILMEIGRFDRMHYLFLYGRLSSPIVWDVIAVVVYLIGCVLFLYLRVIRDFWFLSKQELFTEKRRKLYKWLAIGFNDLPEQNKLLRTSNTILSVLIVPIAIIVSSILSWIFAMTLRPGWHSSIFGPYFVLAAIYSGIAMVVIILYFYRKNYGLKEYITDDHFKYLGYSLIAFGAGYGYFTFSEYFTDYYTSKEWNHRLILSLFSTDQYGWYNLFANAGGILLPLIVIGFRKLRNVNSIFLVSIVIVVAMWIKRYLIIVPTLENTLVPIQDVRPEFAAYSATWVEWALVSASFAAFALFFTLITRFTGVVPFYTTAKIEEESEQVITQTSSAL